MIYQLKRKNWKRCFWDDTELDICADVEQNIPIMIKEFKYESKKRSSC